MSVSLYANGKTLVELGRYGMTLQEAKKHFQETAEKCGCTKFSVQKEKTEIVFRFQRTSSDAKDPLWTLLHKFGKSSGWCEYPPVTYVLKSYEVPEGKYIPTGICFQR